MTTVVAQSVFALALAEVLAMCIPTAWAQTDPIGQETLNNPVGGTPVATAEGSEQTGAVVDKQPETNARGKTILVLDASGSMWGEIDGRDKISIAREAIAAMVADWDTNIDLGLMAYGHTRKGDCNDIEMLLPPGPLAADTFTGMANSINPVGKTPLTAAVRQAAEALKYTEEKATVVLISDGEETCDLDPCTIGKSLERQGVDFTAHIISFDVPPEQTRGLRCLADDTGGIFLEAKNARELNEAMSSARESVTGITTSAIGGATLQVPEEVTAGSVFEAAWTGPENEFDEVVISHEDEKQHLAGAYAFGDRYPSPATLKAPEEAGQYQVRLLTAGGEELAADMLTVVPAAATVTLPKGEVIAGNEIKVEWTGPDNEFDSIAIYNLDGTTKFNRVYAYGDRYPSPALIKVPEQAGDYLVRLETGGGKELAKAKLTVLTATAAIHIPAGEIIAGNEIKIAWKGPDNEFDNIVIYSVDGTTKFNQVYAYGERYPSPALIKVPEQAGDYLVRLETGGGKELAKAKLTVLTATAAIHIPAGEIIAGNEIKIAWKGPDNEFDSIAIYSLDGTTRFNQVYAYGERYPSPALIKVPEQTGGYMIRLMTRGGKELAKSIFTVQPANASIDAPLKVKASAEFNVAWQGPDNEFDRLIITSPDGEQKYGSAYAFGERYPSPAVMVAPGDPGSYMIQFITYGGKELARSELRVEK